MMAREYTLPLLREILEEAEDEGALSPFDGVGVERFLDHLYRMEEADNALDPASDGDPSAFDEDDPVDLFGVSGVEGVADRDEIAELTVIHEWERNDRDDREQENPK